MNIAELRNRLEAISNDIAQLPEQEVQQEAEVAVDEAVDMNDLDDNLNMAIIGLEQHLNALRDIQREVEANIGEEVEEDAVEETVEVVDEETVEEQEPSAMDIAKMDPTTRAQYFLAKKRMQPDTRSPEKKAADMATARDQIARQKASFDEPKDAYGDMMANRLKKLQQRKAYKDAAADMGVSTRPSRFSFEDEQVEEAEVAVEETVAVPVQELADLLQLAGYENYEQKIEEYANEPNEEYQDAEDQLIGLAGGLNGPKSMHPAAAGGDNPMDQEARKVEEAIDTVAETIYKSYAEYLEEADAVVTETEE